MKRQEFVKLPSNWIRSDEGLKRFRWTQGVGTGSDNVAALMSLMAIAHNADQEDGVARITYDALQEATGLSRAKISNGLKVLTIFDIIRRDDIGRRTFTLCNFSPYNGWCKLPSNKLYNGGKIYPLQNFTLRSITELHAMKIYFLLLAQRGNDTNQANISVAKISDKTGIDRNRIKSGLSHLTVRSMIYTERTPSTRDPTRTANAYRIVGIDPYRHDGTRSEIPDLQEV